MKLWKSVKSYVIAGMIVAGAVQSASACVRYYEREDVGGEVLGCSLNSVTSQGYCMYSCRLVRSYRMV